MKHHFAALLFFLSSFAGNAQEESKTKAEFKLGAYYNSGLNYYGRTDSLRSSGFFPVAELWVNNSFYLNAAPVFVNNETTSFDYAGTVATLGYRFSGEDKLAGNIYLVKPFYESSSQLVQSALKAQVAALFTAGTKMVNINGGGDVKFSDKVDYGVTGGLDKLMKFELGGKSLLALNPSAYINAGTQHFTETYYKQSSYIFFPGASQIFTEEVKRFKILSYEFSMPVILGIGKFQVIGIPAYVLPQNLVSVPGRPDLSERGENMFYITLGAKVNF
jgi:hypothetical protein